VTRFANELIGEAVATLTAHGFEPVVSNGGKHAKVGWVDAAGRRRVLTFSYSHTGNWRTRANSRARLRRLLRGNGTPQEGRS
jgi:hypothetical protein